MDVCSLVLEVLVEMPHLLLGVFTDPCTTVPAESYTQSGLLLPWAFFYIGTAHSTWQ